MQYLILIADVEKQWESRSEAEMAQIMGEFGAYTEELRREGHWVMGAQLQPSDTARSMRMKQGRLETMDGPFAETKEQLGGFYLIEAKDQATAERLAAKCPGAKYGTLELRPLVPRQD